MFERIRVLVGGFLIILLGLILVNSANNIVSYQCVVDGKTIPWYAAPAELTGNIAVATVNFKDEPVILYDKQIISKQSKNFQMHVAAHECAHIQLGHATPEKLRELSSYDGAVGTEKYQQRENDADCLSVETLVASGWKQKQFSDLIKDWRNAPTDQSKITNRIAHLVQCPAYPKQ